MPKLHIEFNCFAQISIIIPETLLTIALPPCDLLLVSVILEIKKMLAI